MRTWGNRSKRVISELDPRLQRVMNRVLAEVADISLITGFRNQVDQNGMYLSGHSRVAWPKSSHNRKPSLAVDFQPYPMPARTEKLWAALGYIAGRAIQIGLAEGVVLRWGGDWNQNGDLTDQRFDDLFHLEIDVDETSALTARTRTN